MTKIQPAPTSRPITTKTNISHMVRPILVVEDQKSSANLLYEKIKQFWQADVHLAHSYNEAKDFLKKHRHEYLAAVCDLNLPDAQNGEILDLVEKAEVRSIALTGAFRRKTRESLGKKLMVDYISKDAPKAYDYVVKLLGRLYRNQFIKVLIIEDSKTALAMLQEAMKLLNFNVFSAVNGDDGLDILFKNKDIRLVITDYEMPKMNGFNFTLKAREYFDKDRLAIIGLSASGHSDLGAVFIKNGANDFLLKPYSFEELLCRVNMNVDSLEHLDYINDLASRDPLTHLYNRRFFFANGHRAFEEAQATGRTLGVAIFDIDFFKQINDQFGHETGDRVLMWFAEQMDSHFHDALIARIGGEEFAVLLRTDNTEEIITKLEIFKNDIGQTEKPIGENNIVITVSIGLHIGTEYGLDNALKLADNNLYTAKRNGRNKLVY